MLWLEYNVSHCARGREVGEGEFRHVVVEEWMYKS